MAATLTVPAPAVACIQAAAGGAVSAMAAAAITMRIGGLVSRRGACRDSRADHCWFPS